MVTKLGGLGYPPVRNTAGLAIRSHFHIRGHTEAQRWRRAKEWNEYLPRSIWKQPGPSRQT